MLICKRADVEVRTNGNCQSSGWEPTAIIFIARHKGGKQAQRHRGAVAPRPTPAPGLDPFLTATCLHCTAMCLARLANLGDVWVKVFSSVWPNDRGLHPSAETPP